MLLTLLYSYSPFFSTRRFQNRPHLMFQPVLTGNPEDTNAKIPQRKATQGIDQTKHPRVNPAASPTDHHADSETPEHSPEKETSKETPKLPAGHARGDHTASQTRPERESYGIGQAKHHSSSEIPSCGGDGF